VAAKKSVDEGDLVVPSFSVEAVSDGVAISVNREVLGVEDAVALRSALNGALTGFVR
jgi:hypothetical protein